MRKLFPFGWIDRDLKELGFLKEMSASAAKLYILYVLAGGANGRSCYSAKALQEATGLSNATIYKARQELSNMGLIDTEKEMIYGRKNKKPRHSPIAALQRAIRGGACDPRGGRTSLLTAGVRKECP